jgi:hypothetical protein
MAIELIDEGEAKGLWASLWHGILGIAVARRIRGERRGFHSAEEARRFERQLERTRAEAMGGPW